MPDGSSDGGTEPGRYRLLGVVPQEAEVRPKQEPEDTAFTWPHFLVRHVVVAAGTVAVVFLLAILFDAPLKDIANPNTTPPVAKAPWYFAGLQELLSHLQPMVAGILAPTAVVLFLFALPFLDRSEGWRIRDRKMLVIVFTVLAVVGLTLTLIGALFRGPGWSWVWPWKHLYLEL
jgi:menaquinol-cytochrome c reductase cytochrome b/c subunit